MSAQVLAVLVSAIYVIVVLALGILANLHTAREFRLSRRATILSHRPILMPLHQAQWLSKDSSPWFPAMSKYPVDEPKRVDSNQVFRVANRDDVPHASISLRNVGQGPAIIRRVSVWNSSGKRGETTGETAVAAGGETQLIVPLSSNSGSDGFELARTSFWIRGYSIPAEVTSQWEEARNSGGKVHFLEVDFEDIFDDKSGIFSLRAWFDPRGFGSWRIAGELSECLPRIDF